MADKTIVKKENSEIGEIYKDSVAVGTEEMTQADLNTPVLKVIQPNTQNILGKTDGWFYRNDTKTQIEEVMVNLVYVTTQEVENFNKTGLETVKIYFGFYAETNEPFKMFCRGWALGAHRAFQTQIARIKGKFKVPMLALTVKLTSEEQTGNQKDSGKPYLVYKPVFTILKNEEGDSPLIEMNSRRISFLVEAANRFKEMSQGNNLTEKDIEQNETFDGEQVPEDLINESVDEVNPEEIPF